MSTAATPAPLPCPVWSEEQGWPPSPSLGPRCLLALEVTEAQMTDKVVIHMGKLRSTEADTCGSGEVACLLASPWAPDPSQGVLEHRGRAKKGVPRGGSSKDFGARQTWVRTPVPAPSRQQDPERCLDLTEPQFSER